MKNSKLGFTFVEVIIAMAIFAILIVGIFPAFLIGIKLNEASRISVQLSSKAQGVIEEIYGYSTTMTFVQTDNALKATYTAITTTSPYHYNKSDSEYSYDVYITSNSPGVGMYTVKVNITKINNPYNVHPSQAETILLFN
jgi:prepilin-type N-terminal cleavage/methylation domain-containing protein